MSRSKQEVAQSHIALQDAFRGTRGLVGERVLGLADSERRAQTDAISGWRGYAAFGDAFLDFALETVDILNGPVKVYHAIRVPLLVASISRFRASYVLFWMGYHFDATSLLRGVWENAVHLCADAHGWVELWGWLDSIKIQQGDSLKHRVRDRMRKNDKTVEALVFRKKSDLQQQDQEALIQLVNSMHAHVHKCEMHQAHMSSKVLETKVPVSVHPRWDDEIASSYANPSLMIAWMFVRLLAHAVPKQHRSEQWTNRRDVLDRSLKAWFAELDTPLAATITRFIDAKFTFKGEWVEPPASAL